MPTGGGANGGAGAVGADGRHAAQQQRLEQQFLKFAFERNAKDNEALSALLKAKQDKCKYEPILG